MDIKPYIAVFFAVIFFGKFLMMDAKFLEVVLDTNGIAYVNPFCKKNKEEVKEPGVSKDLYSESKSHTIAIDSFCNAPFHFEVDTWNLVPVKAMFQPYSYTAPDVPQMFRDRFYPPPKVV